MNPQTPGPLLSIPCEPYRQFSRILLANGSERAGALGHAPKESEAVLGYTRYRPEDAELLAAAYSAFDRAGRKMEIDAVELAKRIDLALLIRAAKLLLKDAQDMDERLLQGQPDPGCEKGSILAMRTALMQSGLLGD